MSIDQNAKALVAEPIVSPIENEIPTYRAISRGAVFALVFGILAILSFASIYFLAFAALAVLIGWRADVNIQKYPDALTGRGIAQTGFGLGLVFGLVAVSLVLVLWVIHAADARRFGKTFAEVVEKGTLNDAIWWMRSPGERAKLTPDQLVKEIRASSNNAMMFDQMTANIRAVKDAIEKDQATFHYDGLEGHGDDGMSYFAAIRYELHSAKPPKPEDTERFALASCRAVQTDKGTYEWVVQDIRFPYQRGSYVPPEKPVDDGHGHGEGSHGH